MKVRAFLDTSLKPQTLTYQALKAIFSLHKVHENH